MAQIAITALSLTNLGSSHWIAKGFLYFSLVSALLAVYYATTQFRTLGRLLQAEQIRAWIRGGHSSPRINEHIVPSVRQLVNRFHGKKEEKPSYNPRASTRMARSMGPRQIEFIDRLHLKESKFRWLFPLVMPCDHCDPRWFFMNGHTEELFWQKLRATCFTPSISAVITMSAPQLLLSAALWSLLVSLGVYLGFTWTHNLDQGAGIHDSRNVFAMYLVSLAICIVVYFISQTIQNEDGGQRRRYWAVTSLIMFRTRTIGLSWRTGFPGSLRGQATMVLCSLTDLSIWTRRLNIYRLSALTQALDDLLLMTQKALISKSRRIWKLLGMGVVRGEMRSQRVVVPDASVMGLPEMEAYVPIVQIAQCSKAGSVQIGTVDFSRLFNHSLQFLDVMNRNATSTPRSASCLKRGIQAD